MKTTIEVVSIFDPALDRAAMDLAAYAGTENEPRERDRSLVKCLPGKSPVIFHLRALTKKQHDHVDASGMIGARDGALSFGLVSVSVPGQPDRRPHTEVAAEGGGTLQIWDEKGLADLQEDFTRRVLTEMALVIISLSGGSGNAWGGSDARRFGLPPSLLLEAVRIGRRSAA